LPDAPSLRPSLANGHLGTVVRSGAVHINGLYNGYKSSSKRAKVPTGYLPEVVGGKKTKITLDLANGWLLFAASFEKKQHISTYRC
jgi:hypothetical protein